MGGPAPKRRAPLVGDGANLCHDEPMTPKRELASIAVPVSLEFVIALVMNFANQVVVGSLGATAIASVGFVGSLTFIIMITVGALGGSVSILTARAHGAGHLHELNSVVHAALALGLAITAVFIVVPVVWPTQFLTLAGGSPTVVAAGSDFLRLTSLALIPSIITRVLAGVLRSVGMSKLPLYATTVTVVANTGLGFMLVEGIGPFPAMGVTGAGVATLSTSGLSTLILAYYVYVKHRVVTWELPRGRSEWNIVLRPLLVLALPFALTELVWSGGGYLYNVIFQRLGDEVLAANQIASTLEALFIVGSFGLMTGATTLIGRSVGQQDVSAIHFWIRLLRRTGYITGVVFGLAYALSVLVLRLVFPEVSDEVRHIAMIGILIAAALQWMKVQNMVLGGGVLPSAGDTKGVLLGDSVGILIVGLPLSAVLGLYTPLAWLGIFIARGLEEIAKLAVFVYRSQRIDWSRVIADQSRREDPDEREVVSL